MDNIPPMLPLAFNVAEAAHTTSLIPQDVPVIVDHSFAFPFGNVAGNAVYSLEPTFETQKELILTEPFLRGVSLDVGSPSTQDLHFCLSRTKSLTDEDKDCAKEACSHHFISNIP